ncbi:MAG: response regulator receiver protein [Pedosphaera sp.]|nr:response regulator receiver protein [Pedosphaera sp.]
MRPKNFTILIADDDPNDRRMIEASFRRSGVTNPIHAVESGEEAIAYLEGKGEYADRKHFAYPSYIICDLKMPRGDGFAVLQHLKSRPEWAVIPTVILSGSGDLDDIKKAYILGASSYIVKPTDLEGLRRITKVLFDFWSECEVPEVDESGKQLITESAGKLGAGIPQPGA